MQVLFYIIALLIVRNTTHGNPYNKLQCKDENNLSVDW